MTKEDIKDSISMSDIVNRYGLLPNRAGFIPCPFHQEDTASMKIYERDFHCFGCGANGDIFDFVQAMEHIDFREAFQALGGTYEKPTFSSRLSIYRSQKRQEMARKERECGQKQKRMNNTLISIYRGFMERSEPFSDTWTDCYNRLQYQLYLQAELNGMEMR